MAGKKLLLLLALLLALVWLVTGCAELGVLYQTKREDGSVQRLRVDGGEDWGDYDITPRYQSQKRKDQDGYYVMLKNEATF
jgi:hypothetical protein